MTKSLIQQSKECIVCRTTLDLDRHHIFQGRNRKKSDQFGCTCWLCKRHHTTTSEGVHFNIELDSELKDYCQRIFELEYSQIEFMYHFGKNYKQSKYDKGGYKWINK